MSNDQIEGHAARFEHNTEELGILAKVFDSGVFHLVIDKVAPHSTSASLNAYFELFTNHKAPKWLVIPVAIFKTISLSKIFEKQQDGVVQIEQFEQIIHDPELGTILNQQRDRLSRFPITLIFSILDEGDNIVRVQKLIPDMWSIIGFTLELDRYKIAEEGDGSIHFPTSVSLSPQNLNAYRRRYRFLMASTQEPFYAATIAFEIGSHYYTQKNIAVAVKWLKRAFEGFTTLGETAKSLEVCNALIWALAVSDHNEQDEKAMQYRLQSIDMAIAKPNDLEVASWAYKIIHNWKMLSPDSFATYLPYLQQNNLHIP